MTSWSVRGGGHAVDGCRSRCSLTRFPLASYGRFVIVGSVRLAKFAVALTPVNCVWLSALNASSAKLELHALADRRTTFESDRSRLLIGGLVQEEARRLGAVAARLRRREARGVELLVRVAARAAARVAGQHDARGRVVGARQVRVADARDRVADRVRAGRSSSGRCPRAASRSRSRRARRPLIFGVW